MQPTVDIDVNETSGVWMTDGLPMVYVPRHFMVNIHKGSEQALGLPAYRKVLDHAGAKSAYFWCKREAEVRNLDGRGVFEHYLQRLTARGWGQFTIEEIDTTAGFARIKLVNSIYVLENKEPAEHGACYMFDGFFVGGFQFLLEHAGIDKDVECREVQCAAMGADHCIFELKAK